MAYNGSDIKYEQIINSYLCIIGCIFEHNKRRNAIGSLIYFDVIYNSSLTNEFSNDKILYNKLFNLFDGEIKWQRNR